MKEIMNLYAITFFTTGGHVFSTKYFAKDLEQARGCVPIKDGWYEFREDLRGYMNQPIIRVAVESVIAVRTHLEKENVEVEVVSPSGGE